MKVQIKNCQRLLRINLRNLKQASLAHLRAFNLSGAELSILLVNDDRMKALNRHYRGMNRTTDVLSFPVYDSAGDIPADKEALLGDVVINLHAAKRQSSEHHTSFADEVHRLLIHGFLHLLGYDHEKNPYQAGKMRRKEHELRDALNALD